MKQFIKAYPDIWGIPNLDSESLTYINISSIVRLAKRTKIITDNNNKEQEVTQYIVIVVVNGRDVGYYILKEDFEDLINGN